MADVLVVQNTGANGVYTKVMTPQELEDCLNHAPGALFNIDFDKLIQSNDAEVIERIDTAPVGTTVIQSGVVVIVPSQFRVT